MVVREIRLRYEQNVFEEIEKDKERMRKRCKDLKLSWEAYFARMAGVIKWDWNS